MDAAITDDSQAYRHDGVALPHPCHSLSASSTPESSANLAVKHSPHAKRRYTSHPREGTTAGPLLEMVHPAATSPKIIALLDEAGRAASDHPLWRSGGGVARRRRDAAAEQRGGGETRRRRDAAAAWQWDVAAERRGGGEAWRRRGVAAESRGGGEPWRRKDAAAERRAE
jgi:hypothetical protein